MNSGIYIITNKENGKVYIGSTNNFGTCWYLHRNSLRKGVHHNQYLQRSWNKYGEDAFEFGVIEYLDDLEQLHLVEQFWMDVYREEGKELYNFGLAVDNPMRGQTHTEETKRKMSEVRKGVPKSEEHRSRISKARMGHAVSEEARRKIGAAKVGNQYALGHKRSEEARRKMSESAKRRAPATEEARRKMSESAKARWARRRNDKN